MGLEGNVAGHVGGARNHARVDVLRRFFEGAVLQESGEQEIPGLQVRLVRVFLLVEAGQEVGGFHVEKRCGDDQEFGRA